MGPHCVVKISFGPATMVVDVPIRKIVAHVKPLVGVQRCFESESGQWIITGAIFNDENDNFLLQVLFV